MQRSGHIIMADYAAVHVVLDVVADVISATAVVVVVVKVSVAAPCQSLSSS